MKNFTLDQMIDEAKETAADRERGYARQVLRGKIDESTAHRRIECMKNIARTLEWIQRNYERGKGSVSSEDVEKPAQAVMNLGVTESPRITSGGIPD